MYVKEGQHLDALVEATIKDDEQGDPPASRDILEALGITVGEEYGSLRYLTRRISSVVKEELEKKGMELYDIKLEFGRNNGSIILIDEISAGNMRVYRKGKKVEPLDLVKYLLD